MVLQNDHYNSSSYLMCDKNFKLLKKHHWSWSLTKNITYTVKYHL